MRASFSGSLATAFFACGPGLLASNAPVGIQSTRPPETFSRTYIGFDRNRYPGDSALKLLRQNFSFSGYWLNTPPNETSNTWEGKHEVLTSNGFGFLLLFNGRLYQQLKAPADPGTLGKNDAAVAVRAAKKEGFSVRTVIFSRSRRGREIASGAASIRLCVDRRCQRIRVSSGSLLLRNPTKRGGRNDNYYRERFTG